MKKIFLIIIIAVLTGSFFFGCNKNRNMEDSFSFSIVWGIYGERSYDSVSGELIKTKNAAKSENYTATMILNSEKSDKVKNIITRLDLSKYPQNYNPGNDSVPTMTIILKAHYNDTDYSISCINIALSFESDDEKGQAFLTACKDIISIITGTSEWQALPDYED